MRAQVRLLVRCLDLVQTVDRNAALTGPRALRDAIETRRGAHIDENVHVGVPARGRHQILVRLVLEVGNPAVAHGAAHKRLGRSNRSLKENKIVFVGLLGLLHRLPQLIRKTGYDLNLERKTVLLGVLAKRIKNVLPVFKRLKKNSVPARPELAQNSAFAAPNVTLDAYENRADHFFLARERKLILTIVN